MRKKFRIALTLLLAVVFLSSGGLLLRQHLHYEAADDSYDAAQDALDETVFFPEETEVPLAALPESEGLPHITDACTASLKETDFAALRETNEDVVGWIMIPDTAVSYPLMQGTDNAYYLNNTWDHQSSVAGSIFIEHQHSADLTGYNTLIYGHRMKNGSMFADLKHYDDAEFAAAHPYVYIAREEGVYRYEVFAAFKAAVTTNTYRLTFPDQAAREDFLRLSLSQTVIDTGVEVSADDQFITLVTCTGTGYEARWVVQARLTGMDPV